MHPTGRLTAGLSTASRCALPMQLATSQNVAADQHQRQHQGPNASSLSDPDRHGCFVEETGRRSFAPFGFSQGRPFPVEQYIDSPGLSELVDQVSTQF